MSVFLNRQAIDEISKIHDLKTKTEAIKRKVGDLNGISVMFNMVLLAAYVRPAMTKGGIIRPGENVEEDVWQGKVGLVIKHGPDAFKDDDDMSFNGQKAELGEWVVFKVGDAWQLTINDWPCRLVRDSSIRMKTEDPTIIV
jgi:hypothetical protein